jgi:rubredoxin-NAD+ reductase
LAIEGKKDIAILGAGLIGCEFANDLMSGGLNVHVIDMSPQLLGRLLPAESAAFMQHRLEASGISFHLATSIQQVERVGERFNLTLANGEIIETDAVLSAVGLKPRTALAADAGIEVNCGIVVNNSLQTSAEDVFALGDCAEVDGHVQPFIMPIMRAARALASTLAGKLALVSFPPMPVTVKTPACPAIILSPEPGLSGSWSVVRKQQGTKATFQSAASQLLGFALLGEETAEKNKIIQSIVLTH